MGISSVRGRSSRLRFRTNRFRQWKQDYTCSLLLPFCFFPSCLSRPLILIATHLEGPKTPFLPFWERNCSRACSTWFFFPSHQRPINRTCVFSPKNKNGRPSPPGPGAPHPPPPAPLPGVLVPETAPGQVTSSDIWQRWWTRSFSYSPCISSILMARSMYVSS